MNIATGAPVHKLVLKRLRALGVFPYPAVVRLLNVHEAHSLEVGSVASIGTCCSSAQSLLHSGTALSRLPSCAYLQVWGWVL